MDRGTDIARRSPRTHAEHLVRWAGVPESGALRAVDLGSDGSGGELITVTAGGSRRPRADGELPHSHSTPWATGPASAPRTASGTSLRSATPPHVTSYGPASAA
ncbi:hypothetical protein ABT150_12150 [Streptomyces mirabilis]|uniref:hypothetical protein n=1 Tax=Streptomyces mirabilis TaxID=68239 RepID=UPI003316F6B4